MILGVLWWVQVWPDLLSKEKLLVLIIIIEEVWGSLGSSYSNLSLFR